MSPPEIVDSVKAFILADRGVTFEDISVQMGTAHKTAHNDLAFSKVKCGWILPGPCKEKNESKTVEAICKFDWEKLPHLLYSADLVPSDFHFLSPLKEFRLFNEKKVYI